MCIHFSMVQTIYIMYVKDVNEDTVRTVMNLTKGQTVKCDLKM